MHVAYYGPIDHLKVLIEIFSSIISYEKPILKSVIGCATLRKFCAKMTEDYFLDNLWLRGGVHPDYFVKLDFEIAVDQQTRARDRTFEGVPDSG